MLLTNFFSCKTLRAEAIARHLFHYFRRRAGLFFRADRRRPASFFARASVAAAAPRQPTATRRSTPTERCRAAGPRFSPFVVLAFFRNDQRLSLRIAAFSHFKANRFIVFQRAQDPVKQ